MLGIKRQIFGSKRQDDGGNGPYLPVSFFRKTTILMIKTIAEDLRSVAERCTRMARDCRRYELSRALQELGIELMAKAGELEKRFGE
jgi:hypothetical protein